MPVAAIVTLVLVGLLVAALAFYFVWVIVILRHITDTLGKVTIGMRAIADRAEPIGDLLAEVNGNLIPVADALEALAGRAASDSTPAKAS